MSVDVNRVVFRDTFCEMDWLLFVLPMSSYLTSLALGQSHSWWQAITGTNNDKLWSRKRGKVGENINQTMNLFLKEMHLKMSSAKWLPCYSGPIVSRPIYICLLYFLSCVWYWQPEMYAYRYSLVTISVNYCTHYNDVIMGAIASQITSLTIVYLTVYSDADQWKHQSSASLAGDRWIPRTRGQ